MNQQKLHNVGNTIGLICISIVLTIAFIDQLTLNELPCPLCLLQRVCFIAVGLCMALNLQHGARTSHYGLMILSALLGFSISLRQIFLHVGPGDTGYGSPIWDIYLYGWAAIFYFVIIGFTAIGLLFESGFDKPQQKSKIFQSVIILLLILTLANSLSTLLECGFGVCPADPVKYRLLSN